MKRLIPAATALACAWGVFAAAAVAVPPGHPPKLERLAPPPGYLDTQGTDRWLAYSTYCWNTGSPPGGICVDYVNPDMRKDLPKITLTRGEVVRFQLEFAPTSITLQVGEQFYKLHPRQNAAWRVKGKGGVLVLFASDEEHGQASYTARIRIKAASR